MYIHGISVLHIKDLCLSEAYPNELRPFAPSGNTKYVRPKFCVYKGV